MPQAIKKFVKQNELKRNAMKTKENYRELLEAYLNGEISQQEQKELDELIQKNPEAASEWELSNLIQTVIADDDLHEFDDVVKSVVEKERKKEKTYHWLHSPAASTFAAAASVIIILGLAWRLMFSYPTPDRIFSKYYTPIEANFTVKSGGNQSNQILFKAFDYFNQQNYQQAAELFAQVLAQEPENIPARFYNGLTDIELEKYPEASRHFRYVINDKDNFYVEEAEWYLGLCMIKLEELDRALEIFLNISNREGKHQEEAGEIVNKLLKMNH